METSERITQRADLVRGKPCIRGTRVTVGMIVGQIGPSGSMWGRRRSRVRRFGFNRELQVADLTVAREGLEPSTSAL